MDDEIRFDPEGDFERTLDFERGGIDLATGEFDATLATDGEATDGHMLSIKGGRVPARMPLLLGHQSDGQVPALGSVLQPRKEEHRIRVRPRVNMNGDDPLADVRRGIAQLISDGDLNQMSVRWRGIKATRRVNLPVTHPAFVPDTDETERRWGLFFEQWQGREGSVVAVGADPKALIGRSENAGSDLERTFWVMLARSVEAAPDAERMGPVASAFDAIRGGVASLQETGADSTDIANAVDAFVGVDVLDVVPYTFRGADGEDRTLHLPRAAWESLRGESLRELQSAAALFRVAETSDTTQRSGDDPPTPPSQRPGPKMVSLQDAARILADAGKLDAATIGAIAREAVDAARGRVRR